jgi:hypothetical protein
VNGTDYVVRSWRSTTAGHARAAVVDRHGRIVHVTVHREHAPHGDIDGLIRDRLATLPPYRLRTR